MDTSKTKETKLALEHLIKGIRTPNATHSTKNAEVEGQEHGKDTKGNISKFIGKKHEDGGMPMQLEYGEKVLSDNKKPNKEHKKLLQEKYNIEIKTKDTYASVLDKINAKIGFKKIEDEQLRIADKIGNNKDVKDDNTKMLNEQAYQKKLGNLEMIKEFKNEKKEEAFDDLYAMQEDGKIKNGEYIDDETGIEVKFEDGGMMFKRGQLPLLTRLKLSNNYRTQEEINSHFSNKLKNGGMKQKAHYGNGGEYTLKKLLKDRSYGQSALNAYIDSKADRPNYDYGDLPQTFARFKALADKRGLKYEDINPKDLSSLGKLASRTQKYDFEKNPELAVDYGLDVPLTKSGVDLLLKNPLMLETLQQSNPTLLNKLKETSRGMLENKFTESDNSYISDLVRATGDDKFKETFAKTNYNDNRAYFRGIDNEKFYFTDENEFNKYKDENKDKKIGDYYKTGKSGIYVQPVLLKDKEFNTEEEKKQWLKDRKADDLHREHFYDEKDIAYTPVVKGASPAIASDPNTDVIQPEAKDEISLPKRLNNPKHFMTMQHTPPPSELKLPMLINPQVRDQTFIKVSPEQAVKENQRGLAFMADQLKETESGTQGAAFANLAGKMFEGNNEAISAANIWNANQRVNYDNEMSRRLDAYDVMRMNNLSTYVNQSQLAEQNTFNDWRTYFQDRDIIERKAAKDAALMNMYEAITPTQNLDPRTGRNTYTKPAFGQWIKGYKS